MSRARIERQLNQITDRLRALREEQRVGEEQLGQMGAEADDARLRALVSETPLAARDHREAQRHADAMQDHLAELRREIARLEATQDQLLDRLLDET